MSLVTAVKEETNLAGVMKSQLTPTGLSFTALFYDTKTGVQRTPQSTTLTFMVNKDGSKAERIRLSSHSTVAATGITTCTIASSGRALPLFGTGAGSSTGNQHEPGDPIGCVTNHEPAAQINDWMGGTVGSSANALRVGAETDSDIYYYAQNSDASKPFLAYLAASNAWAFSNDGVSSTLIGSGASAYTGGDGLLLTGSDFDIDLADTVIFVSSSSGAGDSGKVARLNGSGKFPTGFITAAPFTTYISDSAALVGGPASNADALHTHSTLNVLSYTAYEAITADNAVALLPVEVEHFSQLTGVNLAFGDVNARARYAIKIIPTVTTSTLTTMQFLAAEAVNGATTLGDLTLSIQTDNAGAPSGTVISNGTANAITQVTQRTWNTTLAARTATWATPPTLTAGTTYWIVFQVASLDAANYLNLGVNSTYDEHYLTFTRITYDAFAGTWGNSVTNATPFFWFNTQTYLLGFAVVPTDADFAGRAWRFEGFATATVAALASVSVETDIANLTGLIANGKPYWLSSTAGAITQTKPTSVYDGSVAALSVGYALSSTQLQVDVGDKVLLGVGSGTTDVDFRFWGRLKQFELAYSIKEGDNVTTGEGFYDGTTNQCSGQAVNVVTNACSIVASTSGITVDGSTGTNYASMTTLTDIGAKLDISTPDTFVYKWRAILG
jgi:hypothetical protein